MLYLRSAVPHAIRRMFATMTGDIMLHTLKAIFDKRSSAKHVLNKLLASGYKNADATPTDAEHDQQFGASVRHSFSRVFGPNRHEDHAPSQDDDASPQHAVIFASESEPEAERAAGIIDNAGPVDVEEQHEPLDPEAAGSYLPGVAAMRTIYPPGTEPGSLQFRAPDDSPYFGTQSASSPPTGNTFQHRMGANPWARLDAVARDTAYHYGEQMHASDPSPARSWEEAEPSLQSGWEHKQTHAALPAWHKIKEAVRRGWDRVKH
jgi:hypothetical protein